MGFRQGSYARIFSVEDKGNYSVANVTISKKNKNTNEYETEFKDGFVRLVGAAHNTMKAYGDIPQKGVSVKINSCDVTNKYIKESNKTYTNFVIFELELQDAAPAQATPEAAPTTPAMPAGDDDLPF